MLTSFLFACRLLAAVTHPRSPSLSAFGDWGEETPREEVPAASGSQATSAPSGSATKSAPPPPPDAHTPKLTDHRTLEASAKIRAHTQKLAAEKAAKSIVVLDVPPPKSQRQPRAAQARGSTATCLKVALDDSKAEVNGLLKELLKEREARLVLEQENKRLALELQSAQSIVLRLRTAAKTPSVGTTPPSVRTSLPSLPTSPPPSGSASGGNERKRPAEVPAEFVYDSTKPYNREAQFRYHQRQVAKAARLAAAPPVQATNAPAVQASNDVSADLAVVLAEFFKNRR